MLNKKVRSKITALLSSALKLSSLIILCRCIVRRIFYRENLMKRRDFLLGTGALALSPYFLRHA
ncbi:hypothetical protein [Avibacterium paragallinarum]|uniref:hypothetical protein n=1 Tax=Avibacterium paragallinarum TaxID=728 RepID=UPI00034A9087|nr:hypothetical protein [Avibacterium paragallinarum]RZN74663.1 hypothetical protein EC523_11500 [Avibacterium paragallinarum]